MSSEIQEIYSNRRPNWAIISVLLVLHAGAFAALFMFSWRALLTGVILYWVAVGLGISMGYHRLHTHRSYKLPRPLEYFLAFCGTLSLEGGPIFWVATHRIHHQFSDRPGDPHSPRDGAWWAHIGWLLVGESKHNDTKLMAKYAPDLARDPFYANLNTYHWVPIIAVSILLYVFGGLPMLLWATCVRLVFGLHATWAVNSVTHLWGHRRFNTRDDSRNNVLVALISFGEGWHNNHHAHPTSARHGLAWWEIDFSWIQISILKALGIAKGVKVAKVSTRLAEREAA